MLNIPNVNTSKSVLIAYGKWQLPKESEECPLGKVDDVV
jgi:hypothetical protein